MANMILRADSLTTNERILTLSLSFASMHQICALAWYLPWPAHTMGYRRHNANASFYKRSDSTSSKMTIASFVRASQHAMMKGTTHGGLLGTRTLVISFSSASRPTVPGNTIAVIPCRTIATNWTQQFEKCLTGSICPTTTSW